MTSQPPGRRCCDEAIEQDQALFLGEVDRDVAAEDDVVVVGQGPDAVPQVEVAELDQVADLRHDPERALAGPAPQQEEPAEPGRRDPLHVPRGVDGAGGDLEHLQREVAGPDVDLGQAVRRQDLRQRHGHAVGLLARRAPRRPEPDRRAGRLLQAVRHLLAEEREMRRLTEERGVVDRAQVDQQLGAPAVGLDLEDLLVKLGEAGEPLDLESRAEPGLEQPHAVGLEGDADLVAQERDDRSEVLLRPGFGLGRRGWQHTRCRHVRLPHRSTTPAQRKPDPHPVRARSPPGDG